MFSIPSPLGKAGGEKKRGFRSFSAIWMVNPKISPWANHLPRPIQEKVRRESPGPPPSPRNQRPDNSRAKGLNMVDKREFILDNPMAFF